MNDNRAAPLDRAVAVEYASWFKALADGKQLSLDLSDSGPWDLAGVQLLVSVIKTARDRDRPARLVSVPQVCVEVAERCGLAEWLRVWQE